MMAVVVLAMSLLPIIIPHLCLADFPPAQRAVLDSLTIWHSQSRPDLVDSLATMEIPAARAENDTTYLLELLRHSGCTRAAFGLAKQAEPDLREVCRMASVTRDTTTWLQGLRWLSVAVGRQGRSTEAVEYYHELGRLARSCGDSLQIGWSELGLAYDHYLNGRSEMAIDGYGLAAGILERAQVMRGALWAFNGQGMALRQEGRFSEAARCFQRSLELAIAQGDKLSEAMALNYLGRLEILMGDPDIAIGRFERAATIHQEYQHHREGLLPLLDIAQARTMQGRFDEAAEDLEFIIDQAVRFGLMDMELLAVQQLADIHLARNRPGLAVELCKRAMAAKDQPSAMARTEISLRLARALAAQGHLQEALAHLEPVSGTASAATTLQLRVSRQRTQYLLALNQFDEALDCAQSGVQQARAAGSDLLLLPLQTLVARAWFAKSEQDSALAAINRGVNQWERVRAQPADPRWRELRSETAAGLFTQGAVIALAGKTGPRGAFDLIQRYKARTLVERMQVPGQNLETAFQRISLLELQTRILQPGMVYWEVVSDEESSVFILVTNDQVLGHVMTERDRSSTIMRRLSDVLTSTAVMEPAPAQVLAASLFDNLPADFRAVLAGAQRLVWSPDGLWHGLPLALLQIPVGEGLLHSECEVSRIPCASLLNPPNQPDSETNFSSEILILEGSFFEGELHFPGVIQEVDWLRDRFKNARIGLVPPDRAEGDSGWHTKGLIHVAAHTRVDDQQPWNTSIFLGSQGTNPVKAAQVANMNLEAGLTVLASCRTVGSRTIAGEGLLGLTSAFLISGVPSVVATLWPVDDSATAVFIARFYNHLADGFEVSTALRLAQNECRSDPAMKSARHWAGFVVVGDGSLRVPLETGFLYWPVGVALIFLATGFVWLGRRLSRNKVNDYIVPQKTEKLHHIL